MRTGTTLLTALLLAGCGQREAPAENAASPGETAAPARGPAAPAAEARWDLQSSGEGVALALLKGGETAAVRLFCPAGARRLMVNVPAFQPICSEERLSFGSGGEAHALVADPRGDAQRGGVTGSGAVPGNLAALISGPISASYGAQSSGPHPALPQNLAAAFAAACADQRGQPVPPKPAPAPRPASACLTQDGQPVSANRLRAIGTEPFWGARIEGRCVTYSHPEDQQGTRVWTRFTGTAASGSWTGTLGGSPFVLRTRPQAGCSDGMSDNRYPIAVTLTVGGEQRSGCAVPL
jgi:uncharacterized membrane protein